MDAVEDVAAFPVQRVHVDDGQSVLATLHPPEVGNACLGVPDRLGFPVPGLGFGGDHFDDEQHVLRFVGCLQVTGAGIRLRDHEVRLRVLALSQDHAALAEHLQLVGNRPQQTQVEHAHDEHVETSSADPQKQDSRRSTACAEAIGEPIKVFRGVAAPRCAHRRMTLVVLGLGRDARHQCSHSRDSMPCDQRTDPRKGFAATRERSGGGELVTRVGGAGVTPTRWWPGACW